MNAQISSMGQVIFVAITVANKLVPSYLLKSLQLILRSCSRWWYLCPEGKVHGANIGPTWVLLAPGGPHEGPINFAIRVAGLSANEVRLLGNDNRVQRM